MRVEENKKKNKQKKKEIMSKYKATGVYENKNKNKNKKTKPMMDFSQSPGSNFPFSSETPSLPF